MAKYATIVMMKDCFRLFVLIFTFSYTSIHSQKNDYIVTTRQFSVEDGLASLEVFCGIQDKEGFIWFGTRNGLNRFDGKNFLLFSQQTNKMQDNKVLQLATDDANHLFIAYGLSDYSAIPGGKVDVMDLTTHEIKTIAEAYPKMPFKESDIRRIENDGTDNLEIITAFPFKLWHYSSKEGFTLKCEMKGWDTINNHYVHNCWGAFWRGNAFLFIDNASVWYYVTADSTYSVNPNTDSIFLGPITSNNKEFLQGVYLPLGKKIFYSKTAGSKTYEQLNAPPEFQTHRVESKTTAYSYTTAGHSIVFKLPDGFYLYNHLGIQKLSARDEIKEFNNLSLSQNFLDRQGNVWICTSMNVLEIKIEKRWFYPYFSNSQQNIETKSPQARGIYVDSTGKIYANIYTHLFIADNNKIKTANPNEIVYAMLNHGHQLYLGGSVLLRFDEDKNSFARLGSEKARNEVWSLFSLSENVLLAGRETGTFLFDITKNQFTDVTTSLVHIPKPTFIYRFIRASDGKIWACAENGLFVLNNAGAIVDYYGTKASDKSRKLPYNKLCDIYQDEQGIFWLATSGGGLCRWDRSKNEFRQFTEEDGLPSNILYRIEADSFGHLWISSAYGLICFNKKDFSIRTYTVNDGISNNEFNHISSFKADDGRMFFGGLNGITAFYPKDVLNDTATNDLPLRVTSFAKFSSSKDKLLDLTSELLLQNKITIEPGDRFFDLEFMLLDYQQGKKRYAYKIEGLDSGWNYIHENFIHLSGLPYGSYVLRVKGQNFLGGAWGRNELIIPLMVLSPYYRRAWFIILCAIISLLSIYLIVYLRTKTLKLEKIKLEKTISDRTSELQQSLSKQDEMLKEKDLLMKEIHHRVKNNLQVISGLLELQNTGIDDEKAKQAILEGQNRVRSIALIHQNLYQNENMASIEFREFISELYRQVHGLFGKSGMKLETNFDLKETLLDIDTAVPLGLIVNELLTNSFKYAFNNKPGKIEVKIKSYTNGEYCLEYYDNGPGLPAGTDMDKVRSLGLRLINRLSKQLGGKTEYAYDNGSKFSIWFKDTMARRSTD